MPRKFEDCVKRGGKVRRMGGPDKKLGLKKDEYVNFCYIDGKSYRGEIKKKKSTKNTMEESMFDENGKLVKVPVSALTLTDQDEAVFEFSEIELEDGKKEKKLAKMTAYSGKTIKGHWMWGDLTIDISGLENRKSKTPILEQHDVYRKVGFSKAPDLSGGKIELGEIQLLNTDAANEFQENSKIGFPYEASISAYPSLIEFVEEGEKSEVNGFSVKGPHTIFRKAQLKEASVAVFGWDQRTQSTALSENSDTEFVELDAEVVGKYHASKQSKQIETQNLQEDDSMDLNELKTKHPELYKQVRDEGKDEASASFSQENKTLMDELKSFKDQFTQIQTSITNLTEEQKQQKIELTQKEVDEAAAKIQADCLKGTQIPEEIHGKINIDHTKFVQEDDNKIPSLKVSEFTEHVKSELKVWDDQFKKVRKQAGGSVMGLSFSDQEKDADTELAEENDATVTRMLKHIGVKTEAQQ